MSFMYTCQLIQRGKTVKITPGTPHLYKFKTLISSLSSTAQGSLNNVSLIEVGQATAATHSLAPEPSIYTTFSVVNLKQHPLTLDRLPLALFLLLHQRQRQPLCCVAGAAAATIGVGEGWKRRGAWN